MTDTLERLQAALADRYTIERELGAGGMATVFLAADLKHGRRVAIKVLHPELGASIGTERFDREIRLAAGLQHPHIMALYDSGEADGLLYYVMPYVIGESLRDRINREQMLPVEDAVQIALEVADALGYAHMMGVVHRDIKPENILLSGGHALVADFGIARAASAAGEKLTQTGVAIGTPLYMSPEQAVGENVGPTSDLYSLGCVLYEMLSGDPPFTGNNARAIMARHAMTPVPSLQEVRATVPDEIEDAVMACLAKVPADRPQTAAQFCDMLGTPMGATASRRSVGARMSSARHPQMRVTAQRMAATREIPVEVPRPIWRRPAVIGFAALLLLGGVFAALRLTGHRTPIDPVGGVRPSDIAVLYFDDLSPKHDLGYLADGLTEGLISRLSQVRNLNVVSKGGSAQFRGTRVSRDSIARALAVGTLVMGSVEPDGDKVRVTVRLTDAGGSDFERVSFEEPNANLLLLADTLSREAARLIRKRLGQEIRLREERTGTTSPDAWALEQRANQARRRGDSVYAAGAAAEWEREYQQADSFAASAEKLDPKWPEPVLLRGTLDYWRARRALDDAGLAGRMIDSGMVQAERALSLDKDSPDGYELRGNLKYYRWLFPLEPDSNKAKLLLKSAQQDLEHATQLNPSQAGAFATLSHLYNQLPDKTSVDVSLAARQALEADAYLSNADVILSRLFFAAYDLGQFPDAENWCRQGHQRFPDDPRFTECQLWLLTTKQKEPDVGRAWKLADTLIKMTPAGDTAFAIPQSRLIVSVVLARSGQRDSARKLLAATRENPAIDPQYDLSFISAFAWLQTGDTAQSLNSLAAYLVANPARRQTFAQDPGWWLRGLQNNPRFRQMVGAGR
ncbi:MAG TPA: serine/threonine-protein kinase [Gemmatimonadales bacterium]|nr:serine/threonine-protein kinase [Gemmatimonadales bacterium]